MVHSSVFSSLIHFTVFQLLQGRHARLEKAKTSSWKIYTLKANFYHCFYSEIKLIKMKNICDVKYKRIPYGKASTK